MRACMFVTSICAIAAFAQSSWERNYGGPANEMSSCAEQTMDGGYIIVAGTNDTLLSNPDLWLIRTDADGDTLWTKTYGGPGNDGANSGIQTRDSGFILAGSTDSYGNGTQIYLVKTNASGAVTWSKVYGGPGVDYARSVRQTFDGGYIVAGWTDCYGDSGQVSLIKIDAGGDSLWGRVYGGAHPDWPAEVEQTSDSGYIVVGTTNSFGNGFLQVYLLKVLPSGDPDWSKAHGGTDHEYGNSVQQTADGGYIFCGATNSYGTGWQLYLVKTNAAGDTEWTRAHGGADIDEGNSVRQTADHGYIIAGVTYSYGNSTQVYLVRTDEAGDTLWTRTYGGTSTDGAKSVRVTADSGYVIAGSTESFGNLAQAYVIKTEENGMVGVADRPASVAGPGRPTPGSIVARGVLDLPNSSSLLDITGRSVLDLHSGANDVRALAPGVYFVRSEPSAVTKVVVTR